MQARCPGRLRTVLWKVLAWTRDEWFKRLKALGRGGLINSDEHEEAVRNDTWRCCFKEQTVLTLVALVGFPDKRAFVEPTQRWRMSDVIGGYGLASQRVWKSDNKIVPCGNGKAQRID